MQRRASIVNKRPTIKTIPLKFRSETIDLRSNSQILMDAQLHKRPRAMSNAFSDLRRQSQVSFADESSIIESPAPTRPRLLSAQVKKSWPFYGLEKSDQKFSQRKQDFPKTYRGGIRGTRYCLDL